MSEMHSDSRMQQAAQVIADSHHLIAFTGAGISAESGIPTFRGDNGIWQRYDPRVLETGFFRQNPAESWRAIRDIFYATAADTRPNPGHHVLADWEQHGLLHHIITQNIDDLHHRAGSRSVSEYHGSIRFLRCQKTGKTVPFTEQTLEESMDDRGVPVSPWGGILKPDFVFFGEGIPLKAASRSELEARNCDVMLVIGSTGEVYPAAQLPEIAAKGGAWIIEINPQRSNFTPWITDIYLPYPAGEALPALAALIGGLRS
ncbi:SIR2 family NAD-dependent protein deacylase [Spirochaeta africana]|uniref:protein acetyllysine N-acetyltransferase n=1 Tax=Spirochaeta africana (strain ATCC 700263 / DSM 8902 / Z-7692) TaxID=889378 RepID=H9UM55_SPIAZ|nr:NAD-dependent deacylase [Spirochaeta africana]AFG38598.1 NAD-dependent protein deacetylase, SIR2 family [Spirochaeta africana DSM 8902]